MLFDNGVFALEIPDGWSADEGDDGNVYIVSDARPEVWVSVEPNGVVSDDKEVSAESFVLSTYEDKAVLPSFLTTRGDDGRYVARWQETRIHEGKQYLLMHGLVAWNESATNLQMLMFQGACPDALVGASVAAEAQALAWAAPATVHFYRWQTDGAA